MLENKNVENWLSMQRRYYEQCLPEEEKTQYIIKLDELVKELNSNIKSLEESRNYWVECARKQEDYKDSWKMQYDLIGNILDGILNDITQDGNEQGEIKQYYYNKIFEPIKNKQLIEIEIGKMLEEYLQKFRKENKNEKN